MSLIPPDSLRPGARLHYLSLSDDLDGELSRIQALASEIWYTHYPGIISFAQISYMLERDYSPAALAQDLVRGVIIVKLEVDRILAGFAAWGPSAIDEIAKVHKLYLAQSFHGQGFGSMILKEIENETCGAGFKSLTLNVNKHNRQAIRAYRRAGYQVERSVLEPIGGGFFVDDFVMIRQL